MSTLSDVAARAGVSVSAASRVLSNAPSSRVSGQTRQRIEDAARELNYRPNFAARALKFSRTNVIALVVPDLTNAIFTDLMRGVEDAAAELGYMVLLARAESIHPAADTIATLVGEGRVDGLLVQVGDGITSADLTSILDGRVPGVLINSRHDGNVGSVILPDADAARVAVEHLVGLGHAKIGLVNGSRATDTAKRRASGFTSAMNDAGLTVNHDWVTWRGYGPNQGGEAMRFLAAMENRPSALVVANVNAALGLLLEARRMGIVVPHDLSIVAIHDAWIAENTWPPLTAVRMPLYELGRQSVSVIVDRLRSDEIHHLIVTDPVPMLIPRESTAAFEPHSTDQF